MNTVVGKAVTGNLESLRDRTPVGSKQSGGYHFVRHQREAPSTGFSGYTSAGINVYGSVFGCGAKPFLSITLNLGIGGLRGTVVYLVPNPVGLVRTPLHPEGPGEKRHAGFVREFARRPVEDH